MNKLKIMSQKEKKKHHPLAYFLASFLCEKNEERGQKT